MWEVQFSPIVDQLDIIKQQAQLPELEEPIALLREWQCCHFPGDEIFCDILSGNLATLKKPYLEGRIPHIEFERGLANIRFALLEKVKEYERRMNWKKIRKKNLTYHAFTCDRVDQSDAFEKSRPTFMSGKIQFFYLFGGELQAHKSFFTRLAFDFEGLFITTDEAENARKAFQIQLSIKESRDPQLYREKIIRDLFTAFGLNPDEHHPLQSRGLQYLIEKSPKIKELKAVDAIFVLAHVSHWTWDKILTPAAARWFIHEFCHCNLPADLPTFLFFFSFDYDEEFDPAVKAEILAAVEQSEQVQGLPELGMVRRRDVGAWLATNQQFVPTTQQRNEILSQHFSASEYYMENVEQVLTKIIDDSKNRQIP